MEVDPGSIVAESLEARWRDETERAMANAKRSALDKWYRRKWYRQRTLTVQDFRALHSRRIRTRRQFKLSAT